MNDLQIELPWQLLGVIKKNTVINSETQLNLYNTPALVAFPSGRYTTLTQISN